MSNTPLNQSKSAFGARGTNRFNARVAIHSTQNSKTQNVFIPQHWVKQFVQSLDLQTLENYKLYNLKAWSTGQIFDPRRDPQMSLLSCEQGLSGSICSIKLL